MAESFLHTSLFPTVNQLRGLFNFRKYSASPIGSKRLRIRLPLPVTALPYPEMFSRLERNFVAGLSDPKQTQKGLRFRGLVDHRLAMNDIETVFAELNSKAACNGKIGVVGTCFGGTLAYLAAVRLSVDAAVAYYGTQIHVFLDEASATTCPTLLHMGTADDHVPEPLREKIRIAAAANPAVTIHLYDAEHAFANSARTAYYCARASRTAHAGTFEIFDALRSPEFILRTVTTSDCVTVAVRKCSQSYPEKHHDESNFLMRRPLNRRC